MICNKVNFLLSLEADWFRSLFFVDPVTELPIDISGATAVMTIRKTIDGAEVASISTGNGITIDGPNGRIDMRYTAAETAAFDVSGIKQRTVTEETPIGFDDIRGDGYAAYYALEVTYSSGVIERVIDGVICLIPGGVET